MIVTLHDGARMWSADESHLADALAAIVRAMREGSADGDSEPECTGISAGWCPRCGDCTCPDRAQAMDTPTCPLHGTRSKHAEEPEADPRSDLTMRRDRPTVPEVRALAKLWSHRDGCAFVLLRVLVDRTRLVTMHVAAVIVEDDGSRVDGYAAPDMYRLDRSEGWLPLGPDGIVTPSELARLVAGEGTVAK